EESGQEANLVTPTNGPITPDRGRELLTQVGWTGNARGQWEQFFFDVNPVAATYTGLADHAARGDVELEFPREADRQPDTPADAFLHADMAIRLERSIGDRQARQMQE